MARTASKRAPESPTEADLHEYRVQQARLKQSEGTIEKLRHKILSYSKYRKMNVITQGRFICTVEWEKRKYPSYKDAVINLAGVGYVDSLIANTKPTICPKIKVVLCDK